MQCPITVAQQRLKQVEESQMSKQQVGIGLVGSGFMGRCHANAFRAVSGVFDVSLEPRLEILADASYELAACAAQALGFRRSTGDWRSLVADEAVDIVAITAPNVLHAPIAHAAITAGKTVYCEKPLSTTAAQALEMTEAAEAAGVVTLVGFNFLRNPMIKLAREIIDSGEIGEVTGFRGRHAENYMADPEVPHSFRTDPQGGGALADIGSHIISMARYLLGPMAEVQADCRTIHRSRPIYGKSEKPRALSGLR
jgi:predicted dehydrogenase